MLDQHGWDRRKDIVLPILKMLNIIIIYSFIHSTYIAPLQDTTTRRHSQPSHAHRRRTWGRYKIW